MKSMRKRNKIFLLVIFLLIVSIGYALIYTDLKIGGIANVLKQTWDIHFDNVHEKDGSITPVSPATIDSSNTTKLAFNVYLKNPGDFYEFTFDIVNNGSIDAMITGISSKLDNEEISSTHNFPDYVTYTVSYEDGVPLEMYHLLRKKNGDTPTTEKARIRIEFRSDIDASDLAGISEINANLKFELTYSQANDMAIDRPGLLDTYTWDEIIAEYNNGNPSEFLRNAMAIGAKKTVQLDMNNDGTVDTTAHVRLANITKPSECSTSGFSQSACGLVFEFVEVLTSRTMNQYVGNPVHQIGDGNNGGWPKTELYAYLNSKLFEYRNVDYRNTGFYTTLPSDLRNKIIDTVTVSGCGAYDSGYITSTDKIYLLACKEVWGKETEVRKITFDNGEVITRQLDYYKSKSVTTAAADCGPVIKKDLNGAVSTWRLRTPNSGGDDDFFYVGTDGAWQIYYVYYEYGVSPAFRIAN